MDAAILAVGTELLGTARTETNSLALTRLLDRYGVTLRRKMVVGDDREEIVDEVRETLPKHEILLITGGLGPTSDDVTKEAVAEALGLKLELDNQILQHIEKLFSDRGMTMPAVNRKQAMVFAGQRVVPNPRGTAPGFHLNVTWDNQPRHVWIFPGVPYELDGMLNNDFEPWLRESFRQTLHRRIVKVVGLTESSVEEKLAPFYKAHSDDAISILAGLGEIEIHLQAEGDADHAYPKLIAMEKELRDIYRHRVYGLDDETLPGVVGRLLASRGETLATAESCTGGLLGDRITSMAGSSGYFLGGVVTYSREAKMFLLGVDPALLDAHGEVSEEVAGDMARGVRRRFSTTWGIAITGIAGPTGGSARKPVGTVHIAISSKDRIRHRQFLFNGTRGLVKRYSVLMALNMLRLEILGVEEEE